jgi:formate hydrogenlyase subunit 3/multisubunit Na+/H+ antiporter MnhD subunit
MNRVGDMLLSIGFFAMIALFGSLDYATIFSLSPYINETYITIIGLLIFAGATAKSAQIPLHVWLPASMEGTKYALILRFLFILKIIFCVSTCYFILFFFLDFY